MPGLTIPGVAIPALQQRLTAYLRARGLKSTQQREVILRAFVDTQKHVAIDELLRAVRAVDPGVGHATVYRTMKLFVEAGIAAERHFADGATQFEPVDGDAAEHHDHLICLRCQRIVEFEEPEIERLQETVARQHGFILRTHRMELYGLCAACRAPDSRG